ncbi:MAG: exo-alpha-sialidase, partial [Flavobacteriaceae bacterium]|nr:exo-alpha-sialidase [Flavobacteriaceae bacterium]
MKSGLQLQLFFVLFLLSCGYASNGQSNNCLSEDDIGYNPPRSLTEPGVKSEYVSVMKLSDKTDPTCLFGIRAVFNNDGLGILCGYKIGNPTGKRNVLYGEEYTYHFYLYKSTDGLNWSLINDPKIKKIFTDTVGYAGFKSYNPPYGLFSDGKSFYLTDQRKPISAGTLVYYSTGNGDKWDKIELRDKDLSTVYSFSIYNTKVPAIIGNYGWPMRNVGIYSKTGNEWKLASPSNFPSNLNFIAWQGREISYHQVNGYLFAGKEKPYYLYHTSSDRTLLVLGESDDPNNDPRYRNRTYDWYVYPASVHMSRANPQIVYADFGNLGIYKSINGGKTFTRLAEWPGIGGTIKIYPICDDGTLFTGLVTAGGTSIFRSDDGGRSWKGIARVSLNTICDIDILPDGGAVLIANTGVWRLKEGCKKTEPV